MKPLSSLNIDHTWTLFLDRDGVINKKRDNDYVKCLEEFEFLPGVLDAMKLFAEKFDVIVGVTNQQGIGKGLMTENDLLVIHQYMLKEIFEAGGRIDKMYHCPGLAKDNPACRKPASGMGFQAREDFPTIDFTKSIIIGDSNSDMEFGDRLGMKCVKIGASDQYESFDSLINVAEVISSQ